MTLKKTLILDENQNPIPLLQLALPRDVDGTAASAQSSAIQAHVVRIVSVDNALRVAIGTNPTATDTGILVPALGEIYLPIVPGQKVAVKGGKANISIAGYFGPTTPTTTTTTTTTTVAATTTTGA